MDNSVIVGIHQPNFIPWIGYFSKIYQSDIFIFLDDVQFIKTGSNYTNRVAINMHGTPHYITIPIKRGSGVQKISNTQFLDEKWKKKVIGTLQANYAKSPYFSEHKDFVWELINFKADNLATYNIHAIEAISKALNFNTKFIQSSTFNLVSTSTQRLIDLIHQVDGKIYISGEGGDEYQEHTMYKEANIDVIYNKIPHFTYAQPNAKEYVAGLSIIDSIFNIGLKELQSYFLINSKDKIC